MHRGMTTWGQREETAVYTPRRGVSGGTSPAETLILDWETVGVSCWSHPVFHAVLLGPSQFWGFPDGSVGKESTCKAGDPGSVPGSGRSTGERIGYPFQYSWSSLVAQMVKNLPTIPETWVRSMHWEDPWRRERLPNPVFWPAEFHGLYSPWGRSFGPDWAIFASLHLASSRWLNGKESACKAGDTGLIAGSGRSPRRGNGNPRQYSYLENPMDRGAWQATVHGGRKRIGHDWATQQLQWEKQFNTAQKCNHTASDFSWSGLPTRSDWLTSIPRLPPLFLTLGCSLAFFFGKALVPGHYCQPVTMVIHILGLL